MIKSISPDVARLATPASNYNSENTGFLNSLTKRTSNRIAKVLGIVTLGLTLGACEPDAPKPEPEPTLTSVIFTANDLEVLENFRTTTNPEAREIGVVKLEGDFLGKTATVTLDNPALEIRPTEDPMYWTVMVKGGQNIDYEQLSNGRITSGITAELSTDTGILRQESSSHKEVINRAPDAETMAKKQGLYSITDPNVAEGKDGRVLFEDIIETGVYDDGEPDEGSFVESEQVREILAAYSEAAQGFIAANRGSISSLASYHTGLTPVQVSIDGRDDWGMRNAQGLEIAALYDRQNKSNRDVIAKHMREFIDFLDDRGFPPQDVDDVMRKESAAGATVADVYVGLINRATTLEEAMRAGGITIAILKNEDLINRSDRVTRIIEIL